MGCVQNFRVESFRLWGFSFYAPGKTKHSQLSFKKVCMIPTAGLAALEHLPVTSCELHILSELGDALSLI